MAQPQSPPAHAHKGTVEVSRSGVRLSRRAVIGFVVTTLATALLLVLLFFRLMEASSQTSSFSTSGNLAGQPAPDFTVQVWNGTPGQKIHLAALKGHPVVVNFYASWCYDCTQEEPFLQAAWQKYQSTGMQFIGIAYQDKQSDSAGFLQKYGVTYPSGQDLGGTASTDYAVTGVPETVLINSQGVIVQKYGGALDERTLNDALTKLVHQ